MAVTRDIGGIRIRIGSDTSDLEDGQERAQKSMKNTENSAVQLGKRLGVLAAAAVAAGAAIGAAIVKNTIDAQRELVNLATVAGTTTSEFSALAYAARSVGVENDKLADIFKDARDRVGDYMTTGAGPLADFFERVAPLVGVTADEFARLSGPEILEKFTASMDAANLSASQQVFFMEALAGDAARLLPLYRDNAALLREMGDRAEQLGISLSDVQTEQIRAAGGALTDVWQVISGLTNVIVAELAPYIEAAADAFVDAATEGDNFGTMVNSAVATVIAIIGALADEVQSVARMFISMRTAALSAAAAVSSAFAAAARKDMEFGEGVADFFNIDTENNPRAQAYREWIDSLDESASGLADQAATSRVELEALMNAPKPSTQLNEWLEDVRAKSEEAAAAAASIRDNILNPGSEGVDLSDVETDEGGGGGGGGGAGGGLQAQLDTQLETLRASLMTTEEAELASHEKRLAQIQQFWDQRMITEQEYQSLMQSATQEHEDKLAQIRQRAAQVEQQQRSQMFGYITGTLQAISQVMDSEGDRQIGIQKAISLAIAGINVAEGITKALTLPFPMNILAAAQTAAQGFAAIASINSASRGNPGTVGGGVSGGAAAPVTPPTAPQTMVIRGFDPSYLYSGEQVRGLAESLIEFQRNGGDVIWRDQ